MTSEDGKVFTANAYVTSGFGFFSFTKKLAEGNEQADWDEIAPMRIAALAPDTQVELNAEMPIGNDGENVDNAFKLTQGDFVITVDLENRWMKVVGSMLGDVNADGIVDVADVNSLSDVILGLKDASMFEGRADVNHDGEVNIADLNIVSNVILGQ